MLGLNHWLNGGEFEQTPGDSEGQESLACCSSWGHKELDVTQQLNNNKLFILLLGCSQLTNNALTVSGEQQKDSAIHIHISIFPQIPLPSNITYSTLSLYDLMKKKKVTMFKNNNQLTKSLKIWLLAPGNQDKTPAHITEFRIFSLLREKRKLNYLTLS